MSAVTQTHICLVAAGIVVALAAGTPAQGQQAAPPQTFENPEYGYGVTLPGSCRQQVGPGTLDAICSTEDEETMIGDAGAAAAFVLEVTAERVPADQGKTGEALARDYTDDTFRQELPVAVCGEPDRSRVKIDSLRRIVESTRVIYTAEVACPEIRFLGLDERSAKVQFVIAAGMRYRLMARALKDEFQKQRQTVDAFLSSFHVLPTARKTP